jgi:ubiquitin carboxyl-terminal hydrolase 7
LNIEYTSEREEDFYDIQLEVEGCGDILESIRRYTAREVLSGDNQYDAGEGRGKQDAEKGIDFTLLPPVLTIHLKRFHFNLQRMVGTVPDDMYVHM